MDPGGLEEVASKRQPVWRRFNKELRILGVVALCGLVAVAVPYMVNKYRFHLDEAPAARGQVGSCRTASGFRIDCLPDWSSMVETDPMAEEECSRRGCCWDAFASSSPSCYHGLPAYSASAAVVRLATEGNSVTGTITSPHFSNSSLVTEHPVAGSSDGQGHVLLQLGGPTLPPLETTGYGMVLYSMV